MSRFVALLNRDGRAAEAGILHRIVAPLRVPGSDAPRLCEAGAGGLAYQCLRASNAPDDLQPARLAPGLSVCFDGRLDNREDLIRELLPDLGPEPAALPDAQLVLACYRRFGDPFARKLNGDFALAVFDAERRQMVLARDVIGVRPLYYLATPDLLVAASEIKAILAHPDVRARPDEIALADRLIGGDPNELRRTFFRDVRRVLPGHTVVVGPATLREEKHWDFDSLRRVRYGSVAEYAEALRDFFAQAVRRRLRGQAAVAVSVSGGLDSSAILCEAQLLRRSGASVPPVHGISHLYPDGSAADEKDYLADIEAQFGARIRRLPASPIRLAAEREWLVQTEYPTFPGGDVLDLLRQARALNCSTVLDGFYGDQVLWSDAHLFDLVRGFRWLAARKAFRAYARSLTDVPPEVLRQEIMRGFVRGLVPDWLMRPYRLARRLASRNRPLDCYSAGLRHSAYRRAQAQRRPTVRGASTHAEHCYLLAHAVHVSTGMEIPNKLAARFGLELAYPFADRDLIAFVMAIPAEILNRDGEFKGLFREAMRGILPESIRRRTWKADFTLLQSEAALELSRANPAASLGPESLAVQFGFIDAAALPDSLARLRAGLNGRHYLPAQQANELLAFELWLQSFFAAEPSRPARAGQND